VGAQLRVYRRRIKSVKSTKKITRAMELIAASRIVKAQQAVKAAQPYSRQITRVISALASQTSTIDHPLLQEQTDEKRAAVLVVTSDRGLAGGYNANALKTAAQLEELLRSEGKEPVAFLIGRKAASYYRFRGRHIEQAWSGFSEQPKYENAREVADALIDAFLRTEDEGGVGEIHVVHTDYVSALSQKPVANRVLPLVVEEVEETEDSAPEGGALPLYEFEPSPDALLDSLLPRYVQTRVYAALLESAASESASRRRAMKAATDNADELIKTLTRAANAARQAEITQEISEIVGGATALEDA
jgi:F-type H+-transporting ATPase subunit gamma